MKSVKNVKQRFSNHLIAAVLSVAMMPIANAAPLDVSDQPLFLVANVPPNILLTIDDSGSMSWGYVPDGISGSDGQPEFHSSHFNPIYYDPDVTYPAPVDENGTKYTTSFTSAWINGYYHSRGSVDLSSSFRYMDEYDSDNGDISYSGLYNSGRRAYYYKFDDTNANCNTGSTHWANGLEDDNDCYTFVQLPTDAVQEQNFANWYSFYRTRSLATASAATLAFAQISGETRVGFQLLGNNYCGGFSNSCDNRWTPSGDTSPVDSRLRKFGGSHREGFYDWLARLPTGSGTPLRRAMERAGEYYSTDEPYEYDPGTTSTPMYACRQNYHIMMTDGIWNGSDPINSINDYDDSSHTLPDGVSYTGNLAPYDSSANETLADVALYYWARDLNTNAGLGASSALQYYPVSLDETVVFGGNSNILTAYWNPKNDPANWQHMVNFLVAVGLDTTLRTNPIQWQGDTYASDEITGNGYRPLASGNTNWPAAGSDNSPANVYDLWHAAINSRGQFFSADSPQEIVNAFSTIINRIQARQGSASNLSINTGSVTSDTQFYQSLFDSADWKGHLLSLPLSDGTGLANSGNGNLTCTNEQRGDVCPTLWDAGGVLTGGNYSDPQDPGRTITGTTAPNWSTGRVILTHDGNGGVPFRWASLSATQKTLLQNSGNSARGEATVEYLRGNRECEKSSSGTCSHDINNDATVDTADKLFRDRSSLLGDLVNSTTAYVGNPEHEYPDTFDDLLNNNTDPEHDYSTFAAASGKGERLNVVYVGSGDGMLHGFRTGRLDDTNNDNIIDLNDSFDHTNNDGREVLAYIPSQVYENLPRLTDDDYGLVTLPHRFYVDGKIDVVDTYFSGDNSWHSMLVSGLGAGGQGIFALDVTDPDNFSEADASSIVLWEFDDSDDSDLGNTMGKANTIRLHNGKFGVIVGNGYNNTKVDGNISTSGNAVLYVLNAETGSVYAKLDTGVGTTLDPTGNGRPNGLGSVTPIDLDGDVVTDFVYAADLFGHVWRFDLTDKDPANWIVSYGSTACASDGTEVCTPLFTATDGTNVQPITSKVVADKHQLSLGYGVMVYFGTGKYFETTDNGANISVFNSVYGVWDADFATFNALATSPNVDNVGIRSTHTALWDLDRTKLLQQKIDYEGLDSTTGELQRILSDDAMDWGTKQGWYVDLRQGNGSLDANNHIVNATSWTNQGEMVTADPLILGDLLVVSTLIPNDDSCSTGGSGWVMTFNKHKGGPPSHGQRKVDGRVVVGTHIDEPPGPPKYVSKSLYISTGGGDIIQKEISLDLEGRRNWTILE